MRLTLRTLLAYLDDMLDPQDVAALRDKLGDSNFANQLVRRIEHTLANRGLGAPQAQAVGPVEEANVISEYLDSTLPAEQVVEIERACLESDVHLAEAAACHQILTLVLGKKANVPEALRQRIYQLPDSELDQLAVPGSFSAVSIPESTPLGAIQDAIPTAAVDDAEPSHTVQPVGKRDSGVSDAPTRLRQIDATAGDSSVGPAAMAGSKPRLSDDETKIYGGLIRTSRLAPWLGSLALVAAVLFILVQIFGSLFDDGRLTAHDAEVAVQSDDAEAAVPASRADNGASVDQTPRENRPPGGQDQPQQIEPGRQAAVDPSAGTRPRELDQVDDLAPPLPRPSAVEAELLPAVEAVAEVDSERLPAPEPSESIEPMESSSSAESLSVESIVSSTPELNAVEDLAPPLPLEMTAEVQPDEDATAAEPAADAVPAEQDLPPAAAVAKVASDDALIAARGQQQPWIRLDQDAPIAAGTTVLCPANFRGQLDTADGVRVTLIGSCQLKLSGSAKDVAIQLGFGRILIQADEPGVTVPVVLGKLAIDVQLDDVDTQVALGLSVARAPGEDPLTGQRKLTIDVLCISGTAGLGGEGLNQPLTTGQQWVKQTGTAAVVSTIDTIPSWVDPPDPNQPSLEAEARESLLALLAGDRPLELMLVEATSFRRQEVAALAAESLLMMGRADVYFGGSGVLSNPKQRIYWTQHYQALMDLFDHGREAAETILQGAANMDAAHANEITSLLTGYSQDQLKAGGDKQLVALLDSPSMTVRVLAVETLRKITGEKSFFRPEQENAIRRADAIDKWEVRLRKGDIRWPEQG